MNQNKKAIFILFIFLLLFGGFLFFLLSGSPITSAIKQLSNCTNVNQVKEKYLGVTDDRVRGNEIYLKAVRDKINSFNPSDSQINECVEWLPARPVSLNLVVVPDLSRRIVDSINCPEQVKNDKAILNGIWNTFKSLTEKKRNSKDILTIDVSDNSQEDGKFRNIADQLIFPLSNNDPKLINEFYFDKVGNSYSNLIDSLYKLAKATQTSGANYWQFFSQYLAQKHYRKSTIYDEIQNKVILITDGYLELSAEPKDDYTNVKLNPTKNPIPTCNRDYSNWSILICEVRERKSDYGKNAISILKEYWYDWLKQMHFKNVEDDFFIESNSAIQITNAKVAHFLGTISSQPELTSESLPKSVNSNLSNECLSKISTLIDGSKTIDGNNIDEVVNTTIQVCGFSKIIIYDGIKNRDLRNFLMVKTGIRYIQKSTSIKNNILTVNVEK